jgi:hypothetical protein
MMKKLIKQAVKMHIKHTVNNTYKKFEKNLKFDDLKKTLKFMKKVKKNQIQLLNKSKRDEDKVRHLFLNL